MLLPVAVLTLPCQFDGQLAKLISNDDYGIVRDHKT